MYTQLAIVIAKSIYTQTSDKFRNIETIHNVCYELRANQSHYRHPHSSYKAHILSIRGRNKEGLNRGRPRKEFNPDTRQIA
jgi:hypothetical protein